MKPEYGSEQYFKDMFSDIICDVCTVGDDSATTYAPNMLRGFELAILDWMEYHRECGDQYRKLLRSYHKYNGE